MSVHNSYSITCFIYCSWKPGPEYISIGFFCIYVPHKIKYIYSGHISCPNYSSTFPMTETPQTVFTVQYFPGSTATQISFLPQSVTWVINCSFVVSTTGTGQFTSPSLQLLLCTSPAELHFLPFFSLTGQIFYPPDYSHCLPWVRLLLSWRVGPVARHSWAAHLRTFQSGGDRLLLAFCSLCACFTFSIWCLPTSQHWHFFLIYICCPWPAIKLYLKTAEYKRSTDYHEE